MNKQEFLETYIADRHNTNCSKWDGLKEKFGEADLLPMWVADMEFKTCEGSQMLQLNVQNRGFSDTARFPMNIMNCFQNGWKDIMVLQ